MVNPWGGRGGGGAELDRLWVSPLARVSPIPPLPQQDSSAEGALPLQGWMVTGSNPPLAGSWLRNDPRPSPGAGHRHQSAGLERVPSQGHPGAPRRQRHGREHSPWRLAKAGLPTPHPCPGDPQRPGKGRAAWMERQGRVRGRSSVAPGGTAGGQSREAQEQGRISDTRDPCGAGRSSVAQLRGVNGGRGEERGAGCQGGWGSKG